MSINYNTSGQIINSRSSDLRGTHRASARSNRDQVRTDALSMGATWVGSAKDTYSAKANSLYASMEKVERDLSEVSRRIDLSKSALDDFSNSCRELVG